MRERFIVDTGILVAAFDRRDFCAGWVADALKRVRPPMVTCEAVLAETWFLLQHQPQGWEKIVHWLDRGFLKVDFSLENNLNGTLELMEKYSDLPMSLADACLVAMVEKGLGDRVFTLDRHFRIYRRRSRRAVPVLMPE